MEADAGRLLEHIVCGRYEIAEQLLSDALARTIASGELWQLRGMLHFARGKLGIALSDFETAAVCGLDTDASNISFRVQTLMALDRSAEARALADRQAGSLGRISARPVWAHIGTLHELPLPTPTTLRDDERTPARCVAASQGAMPASVSGMLADAHAAFDEGDWAAAERQYEAVVEALPQHAPAWLGRGLALLRCGRIGRALPILEMAVRHSHSRCDASISLGWACVAAQDFQRAHEVFEFGLAHCTESLAAWSGLATALALQGMRQAARETIRAVRLRNHDSLGAELAQGILRLACGTPRVASRSLSNRLVSVGRAHALAHDEQVARECFNLARLAMRDLPRTHVELAILLAVHRLP